MDPSSQKTTVTGAALTSGAGIEQSAPSPMLFFDAVNGYQRSAAVKAALDLDLFTALAEGAQTAAALAERCQASPRGVRVLADFLAVSGFLTKEDGRYGLTHDTFVFLNRRSPAFLGSAADFLLQPAHLDAFRHLTDVVRHGTSAINHMVPDNEAWVTFARAMAPMMAMPAQAVAEALDLPQEGRLHVLDVAAGHGLFGIAVALRNPSARIVALDWGNVLGVARENAEAAGLSERYESKPGDALSIDLGGKYDLALVTNFLHHFDRDTCIGFLKRVHGALAEEGRVAILEFVPDENRLAPPMAAAFPLTMLALTPSGDAYTFAEHREMLEHAGFRDITLQPIPPAQSLITAVC